MRNYYKILGLKFEATDEQVKRAYRDLAKQCHPDVHPDDAAAAGKFADISEAYETLGDPSKRAEYDRKVQEMMAAKRAAAAQRSAPGSFAQSFQQTVSQAQANAYNSAYKMAADAQTAGYNRGYTQGFTDARSKAEQEMAALKRENAQLKKNLDDAEERNRQAIERQRAAERAADSRAAELTGKAPVKENDKQMRQRIENLTEELTGMTGRVDRLTAERRYYEEQYNTAKAELTEVKEELETARQQLAAWEEYGKTLDAVDDIEKTEVEWERVKRNFKKRSKPTHYGTLGVMFYAGLDEIRDAYVKLVGRYKKRAETDKKYAEKLFAVNDAYKELTDPDRKAEYDAERGFSQEECEQALETQSMYERKLQTLYAEKEEQEFKAYIEELNYSAQTGDAEAQNTLGEMYYYGDEIEKDVSQALYWFKESAKQRHPEALFNLGRCFMLGDGTAADPVKGRGFIKQAASLGSAAAAEFLKERA